MQEGRPFARQPCQPCRTRAQIRVGGRASRGRRGFQGLTGTALQTINICPSHHLSPLALGPAQPRKGSTHSTACDEKPVTTGEAAVRRNGAENIGIDQQPVQRFTALLRPHTTDACHPAQPSQAQPNPTLSGRSFAC